MKKINPYQFAMHAAMIFLIVDVLFISWQYKKLEDSIKGGRSMEILSVGQDLPSLVGAKNIRTNSKATHDWKSGKYSLVIFYTTWCPHCHATIPKWEALAKEALKNGCDVVAIAADESLKVRRFSDSLNLIFDSYVVDSLKSVLSLFKVSGFPVTYIIDGNGKIVKAQVGELSDDLVEEYQKYFSIAQRG